MQDTKTSSRPPTPTATPSDTSGMVALIESEIDDIRSESSQAGWTTWALMGASATCVWLILNQFETQQYALSRLYPLWLACSFLLFAVTPLYRLLTSNPDPCKHGRLFYSRWLIARRRTSLVVWSIRHVAILFLLWAVVGSPSHPHEYIAYALTSLAVAVGLLGLGLSFTDFPVPSGGNSKIKDIVPALIISGFSAIVLVGMLCNHLPPDPLTNIVEVRIAVLSSALYLLVSVMSDQSVPSPLLSNLIQLRRDIGLGSISPETARDQLEMFLWGRRLADHVSSDTTRIMDSLQSIDADIDEASKRFAALKEIEASLEPDAPASDTALGALREGIDNRLLHAASVMCKDVYRSLRHLKLRTSFVARGVEFQSDQKKLLEGIIEGMHKRAESYNSLVEAVFLNITQHAGAEAAGEMIDRLNAVPGIHFDRTSGKVSAKPSKRKDA